MKPTFIEALVKAEPPWFQLCITDVSSMTNAAFKLHKECAEQFVTLRLRGRKMRNVPGLFSEWSAALQFPHYFGENWNAFEECIKDLDWLDTSGYVLVVLNADQLLVEPENSEDQLKSLLTILDSAAKEWSRPIQQGVGWDRASKPFHVIFQTDNNEAEVFRLRLKKAGLPFSDVSLDLEPQHI